MVIDLPLPEVFLFSEWSLSATSQFIFSLSPSAPTNGEHLSNGEIAGIATGVVAFLILILLLAVIAVVIIKCYCSSTTVKVGNVSEANDPVTVYENETSIGNDDQMHQQCGITGEKVAIYY